MPLSEAQKSSIETSVSHLLNPPSAANEFPQFEAALVTAFTEHNGEDEELNLLWQCCSNPTKYFKNLENQGPAVTIGEVQSYLVEWITQQLISVNKVCTKWDKEKVLNSLRNQVEWEQVFTTERIVEQEAFRLPQIPMLEDSCVTVEIKHERIGADNNWMRRQDRLVVPYVETTINIPNEPIIFSKTYIPPAIIEAELGITIDPQSYLIELMEKAFSIALSLASTALISHLHNIGAEIPAKTDTEEDIPGAVEDYSFFIIANKHYFSLLVNKEITLEEVFAIRIKRATLMIQPEVVSCVKSKIPGLTFSDLSQYSRKEIRKLTNPNILELIKQQLLTIDKAKSLSQRKINLLSHPTYFSLVLQRKIKVDDLLGAHGSGVPLLMLPMIANLIMSGKLCISQVNHLPTYFRSVFADNRFEDLIKRNVIKVTDLVKLSALQCEILLKPRILKQISTGEITLAELAATPDNHIEQFLQNQLLAQWLRQGFLSLADIRKNAKEHKTSIYASGLVQHIISLTKQKSTVASEYTQLVKNIMLNIDAAVSESNRRADVLVDEVTQIYGATMQKNLSLIELNGETSQLDSLLTKLKAKLNVAFDSMNPNRISTCDEIAELTTALLKKIRLIAYQNKMGNSSSSTNSDTLFNKDFSPTAKKSVQQFSAIFENLKLFVLLASTLYTERNSQQLSAKVRAQ